MRKQGEKTVGKSRALIDKKLPKLDEKTRRKINHLMYISKVKNLQNLARKTGKNTWC